MVVVGWLVGLANAATGLVFFLFCFGHWFERNGGIRDRVAGLSRQLCAHRGLIGSSCVRVSGLWVRVNGTFRFAPAVGSAGGSVRPSVIGKNNNVSVRLRVCV